MTQAYVKVEGLRQFTSYLRKVGGSTLPKHIRQANLEMSALAAGRIADAAPRGKASDRDKHPGQLAASTKPRATQRVAKVQIGRSLDYTQPIIFGWKKHHIKANKYPFNVMDELAVEIPGHYNDALIAALQEAGS